MKYKACPGAVLSKICDRYFLTTASGSVETNETGAFYWNLLSNEMTTEEIYREVMKEYDAGEEELKEYTESFLQMLLDGKLITAAE